MSKRKKYHNHHTENDNQSSPQRGLNLPNIKPITSNQQATFDAYDDEYNLLLHGVAGTGKTFISLYLALDDVLNERLYKKVVVVRSVVPTRDMGFLPGNAKQKSEIYEVPYKVICTELFNRGDAYEILKSKAVLEFISTSFIRGTTINDSVVIVDEMQNLSFHELDSIITRVGKNCKIIFCGDFRQSDLSKYEDKKGIHEFMQILKRMHDSFKFVEFNKDDIVRSELVKDYILTKLEIEDENGPSG